MELSIERTALLDALNAVRGAVEKRSTIPILSHVLIDAREQDVQVSATDLTLHVRTSKPAKVKTPGVCAIPAAKLRTLIAALPEGPVMMKATEVSVEVRSGRSRTKLAILPAKDFPAFPEGDSKSTFTIEPDALSAAIERCVFAAGDGKDGRRFLAAILMRPVEGGVRFVGTDSHRLSQVTAKVSGGALDYEALLPPRGLVELQGLLGDTPVSFGVGGRFVTATASGTEVAMRPADENFPKYERLLPESHSANFELDREQLLAVVRRVSVAEDETRHINCDLDGETLRFRARGTTDESVEEIEVGQSGETPSLGFNSRYLMELLGVVPEGAHLEIGLTGEVQPAAFRIKGDDSFLHIIMPMKPRP